MNHAYIALCCILILYTMYNSDRVTGAIAIYSKLTTFSELDVESDGGSSSGGITVYTRKYVVADDKTGIFCA